MGQDHRIVGSRFVIRRVFKVGHYWHGRVRDLRSGRIRKLSTRERNRRRAEQFLVRWAEEQLRLEEKAEIKSARLDSAYGEFLDLQIVSPKTLQDHRYCQRVILDFFTDKFVDEISNSDVLRFLKTLHDKGRSPRTIKYYLSMLRKFYRWSIDNRYAAVDPTEGVKAPRQTKRSGVALSPEEARNLLRACREPIVRTVKDHRRGEWKQTWQPPEHLLLAVLISLHTGLRSGNVFGLCWKHVDLGNRKIRIPVGEMKGNADHEVPIHPELAEILQSQIRGRKKLDLNEPVIGVRVAQIKKSYKSALKRAGLPSIRWHDLRHTFATWASARCSYAALRQLLGHSPGAVTLQYTHVPFEELTEAVDCLPRLLTESDKIEAAESS